MTSIGRFFSKNTQYYLKSKFLHLSYSLKCFPLFSLDTRRWSNSFRTASGSESGDLSGLKAQSVSEKLKRKLRPGYNIQSLHKLFITLLR